jgi:hypothetical protein
VYYEVDEYDPGPLGVLYRPKYFIRGVAVHGYPNVPAVPASHGCVRVTNAAMDWLWASGVMAMGTPVWAIRFALFHLMASVPDCGEAAVGARGLSGTSVAAVPRPRWAVMNVRAWACNL